VLLSEWFTSEWALWVLFFSPSSILVVQLEVI
jgi:hypothetical protein